MAVSTSFNQLKVLEIREESSDCYSIQFEIPAELAAEYRFLPGQYLTLRHQINGEEVRRSFSICSSPDENELRVAIKILPDGKFSGYVQQELKEGDTIEVMPPFGKFTPKIENEKLQGKRFLAFAAGSGITPILGIMKSVLKNPGTKFTLIYGNKNPNSVIFKEQIEQLKNKYIDRLIVQHIFSQAAADAELFNGRITVDKVKEMDQRFINIKNFDEVFVCGPEQMILNLRTYFLDELSFNPTHFHIELFTSPDDAKKATKIWEEKKKETPLGDKTSKVTIQIDGTTHEIEVEYAGETILDKGLMEGFDLPYSCKSGVCTTCKAKLIEGEVDMEVNYGLEPDEIKNNYILTCQSHPKTDKVIVDYDS